jgi:hypothetical protein
MGDDMAPRSVCGASLPIPHVEVSVMHVPTSPNGPHANGHPHKPAAGPDAKPPAADGRRDTHGRFAKGNAGGPGNPFARQVAALRSALLASVTDEDLEAVARELVRQARDGNVAAAKLLLSYTLGKPAPAVDPDTLDLHEWDLYRRTPDTPAELFDLQQRMPLPVALDLLRIALPLLGEACVRTMQEQVRADESDRLAGAEAASREERAAARREARRERRQERAAAAEGADPTPAAPPASAAHAQTLDLLSRLLAATGPDLNVAVAPSANGIHGRTSPAGRDGGPSANGPSRPGGPENSGGPDGAPPWGPARPRA